MTSMEPSSTTLGTSTGTANAALRLGIDGFDFLDLHRPERLADLHRAFLAELEKSDAALAARWRGHCDGSAKKTDVEESTLLIEVARHVAAFVAKLFRIEKGTAARRAWLGQRKKVYEARDRFVKKKVRGVQLASGRTAASVRADAEALLAALPGMPDVDRTDEERWAGRVLLLLDRPATERACVTTITSPISPRWSNRAAAPTSQRRCLAGSSSR